MADEVQNPDNGHKIAPAITPGAKFALSRSATDKLYGQKETPNAVNMLVAPGEDIFKILMRTKFNSPQERKAAMRILAQAEYFHDNIAINELFSNVAASVSEGGMSRNQLVQAIIGDREIKQGGAGGFGSWLRKTAGIEDDKSKS